jgi:hypothetical protein
LLHRGASVVASKLGMATFEAIARKGLRMRKLMMVAVTAAALAIPSSALASASSIGGGTTANAVGTAQGKGTTTQQYKAFYTDSFFGPVSCTGVHQSGKNVPYTYGQDSFTCTSTTGLPLTNVIAGQSLSLATFGGWYSDYWNLVTPGSNVLATSFNGTVSGDGFSFTAVATY